MAVNNIKDLALAVKAAALTNAQIKALDVNSALCANPAAAIQSLRAAGYPITVTTDASGNAQYKINA